MVFSSYSYLIFLTATVTIWLALERLSPLWTRKAFLVVASLIFYAWWRVDALALIGLSIAGNYLLGRSLQSDSAAKQLRLTLGVAANLGWLGVFKYLGLFSRTFANVTGFELPLPTLFLPLAISFFTFQQISWLIDSAKGTAPRYAPLDYVLFIGFFPHLIAGPIVRHNELIPQFDRTRDLTAIQDDLAAGLTLFVIGLFKKVILASLAAPYADIVFGEAAKGQLLTGYDAWLGAGFFAFQIYFDFSAYTDMALGSALMMGIRLPMNFNSPYQADSIIDFWRRWHISLSAFLRDYLYFALGGNRLGVVRRYLNLLLTMLIGGLWHGASWNFVCWGGLHGTYLVLNHLWRAAWGSRTQPWLWPCPSRRLARWSGKLLTLSVVTFAWVFFRAESLSEAWSISASMLGLQSGSAILAGNYAALSLALVLLAVVLFTPNSLVIMRQFRPAVHGPAPEGPSTFQWRPTTGYAMLVATLFIISLLAMTNLKPFIYFQF